METINNKSVAIIGIGNCGSQIANLSEKKHSTLIDSVYINTSEADLAMVEGSMKFKIGEHKVEGSGKNRSRMKQYLQNDIERILADNDFQNIIGNKKYVFIVASAAGGTGSGAAPVFFDIMRTVFPDTHFILVAVLPQLKASLMEHGNTEEFLSELYGTLCEDPEQPDPVYMIYDNETTSHLSPTESLEAVNEAIVEDIRILTGVDNFATPYDSIDAADMESIISTPGRLIVTRINKGLTEKNLEDNTLEDIIIKSIKQSCHAETDRNKKVVRWGIITYFTPEVNKLYYNDFDKLYNFIGTPIERFNHHAINEHNNDNMNFLYLICSGMSPINDRAKKTRNRIEELQKALAKDESSRYIFGGENVSYSATEQRKREQIHKKSMDNIKPKAFFDRFLK